MPRKKELLLKRLKCPSKSVFCLLASHLREASETLKKAASSLWPLQVWFHIQAQMLLDRTGQGRQMWILRGDSRRAWEDRPTPGLSAPPQLEVSWQRENCVSFSLEKFSEPSLRPVRAASLLGTKSWEQQAEYKVLCVTKLIEPLPDLGWFHACAYNQGWGHPLPAHLQPTHTFRYAFQLPFHTLRPQLSQSIATISAGYFLFHRIQNKQSQTTESLRMWH